MNKPAPLWSGYVLNPWMIPVDAARWACRNWAILAMFLVWLLFGLAMLPTTTGCAAGRTDAGGIVLGVEAGRLVDSTNAAAGALADSALTALGVGIPGVGGLVALAVRGITRAGAEKQIRTAADSAYEEGRAAAYAAAAPPHVGGGGGGSASRLGPLGQGVS
jgi:hypothetical protein